MQKPTGSRALAIGEVIAHHPGHAVITLTRGPHPFVVDTYAGPTRLAAVESELDALATLANLAVRQQLAADLAAFTA